MKTIFFATIVFFSWRPVSAQSNMLSNDTVRLETSGFTDQLANISVSTPCQFIFYEGATINWIQAGGNEITSFSISSVMGEWPDLSSLGQATYSLIKDELSGTLEVKRTNNTFSVRLVLIGGTSDIDNLYTITSYEKL